MSDEEIKRRSPNPFAGEGTSRRKRDEDSFDEEPREKKSKRFTPPGGGHSPNRDEGRSHSNRESSGGSSHSSSKGSKTSREPKSGSDRDRSSSRQPKEPPAERRSKRDPKILYEIVRTRPESAATKQGTAGRRVRLETNYFRLVKRPEWCIYQYRVDFEPDIELVRLKRGIMSENKALLGGYLFDGSVLYVTRKLPEDRMTLDTKSRKGEEYKIHIKLVGAVSMNQWQSLQILNLILRRAMEGLQLQLIGRNFFDALEKYSLHNFKMQLWPGYITSIRQHENDIMLCAEITHKVMRTETIYDIMRQCSNNRGDWTDDFKKQVIGLTVLTDYNNKTYRIDDVDMSFKANMTFNMKGKDVSFVDYYYQKYKIRIRDPQQPLLASRNRDRKNNKGEDNRILLVPELCRVTGLTEQMRANQMLMKEMSTYTRANPDRRIEKLRKFNRRLQDTESSQQVLRDWNMSLDRNLVKLEGRQLEPENIVFDRGDKVSATERADWGNQFRDRGMYTRATLSRWAIIYPYKNKYDARDFIAKLRQVARGLAMTVNDPQDFTLNNDNNHAYVEAIDKVAREDPKLIVCLVPNKNAERYATIKKKCCVERAIATQVIACQTIGNQKKGVMSIITKIAIQINAKLGGAPWMISLPMKGLMTIGYDICKSTRDRSKAYAALVATMDQKVDPKYFSTVTQTHPSDNLSNEINLAVGKALHEFLNTHQALPEKIILYRDGVGNGQVGQVYEHEVKNLVKFLEGRYIQAGLQPPRFTFMVVSKSINTRFFSDGRNPVPGTLVDDVVTLPERFDFYLVSQSVRQGTVSPTSYNILYDTSKLGADKLQIITYKMCHLYYNWAGTTRVPAVCQYAKKLATLVGQHIHQIPSNLLEKQLYFL